MMGGLKRRTLVTGSSQGLMMAHNGLRVMAALVSVRGSEEGRVRG